MFDTLVREGERRFLSSLSVKARQFFGKLGRSDVERISGLPVPIAVGRRSITSNPRSTVGTQSGVLDRLRLLFARLAVHDDVTTLTRSHFSFNTDAGACKACAGIGVEDHVDPELLIADVSKTIRGGALVPTLKSGYTVYSQVTVDVMDTIARAHGFDVDTPWKDLTDEQVDVVLFGTKALKVPFGKHALESRMKWEGITARPREEGFYRGLVPVIRETLLRNRNPNILRFVRSVPCSECGGSRLGAVGRGAKLPGGATLPDFIRCQAMHLGRMLDGAASGPVFDTLRASLEEITSRMVRLGLGHLAFDRGSATLSGGEAQRLRLAAHLVSGLGGALYALDEPTLGLHPSAQLGMRDVLDELVAAGNTLLVVEHDPDMVRCADRVIALGPGAGPEGGRIVREDAIPASVLGPDPTPRQGPRPNLGEIRLHGATLHNLENAQLVVRRGTLNVVVGPSGSGKSSLVFGTLLPAMLGERGGPFARLETGDQARALAVDARPMGRSSRSTPATWSGVFDVIRKRFAATEAARSAKLGATAFSFNAKGGRCPECEGLGFRRVGLHLLEDAIETCAACRGARFAGETLAVKLDGRTIADVLALTVREARAAFEEDEGIAPTLRAMDNLGLGYLTLGARSTTLSSGEAQRIRLATLIAKPAKKPTVFLFDEPDRGLHPADLARLVAAYDELIGAGHTIVAISHHRHLWAAADHLTELRDGVAREVSFAEALGEPVQRSARQLRAKGPERIELRGVRTHNLTAIDVDIRHQAVTAITGPSGSGKSSLAFATIAAEASHRFAESLPFQVRRFIQRLPRPPLDDVRGLTPTISLRQGESQVSDGTTLSGVTGLAPLLRLLWSRAGSLRGLTAAHFRGMSGLAGCESCSGRGTVSRASLAKLLTDPSLPLPNAQARYGGGAMAGTRPGRFFTEVDGQHIATLRVAANNDLSAPWQELPERVREIALHGAGDVDFDVSWKFERGKRSGTHSFTGSWPGLLALVEREALKRAGQKSAAEWREPLVQEDCEACCGTGLAEPVRASEIAGLRFDVAVRLPCRESHAALRERARAGRAIEALFPEIDERLADLGEFGLGEVRLDTAASELSRNELQRARLSAVLRSDLAGVTVVLDEPEAGLDADGVQVLREKLVELVGAGNTVVLVTHRRELIESADQVIALGPGAGAEGGRIVEAPAPVHQDPRATGHPSEPPSSQPDDIRVESLGLAIPRVGCISFRPPSGDRVSRIFSDVIAPVARDHFGEIVSVTGAVTAATPLHALGAMGALQAWFADASDLPRAAFSYLSPKGRCASCKGRGYESVAMDFMADVAVPCEACGGTRYRDEVLSVRRDGINVAELLNTPATDLQLPKGKLKSAVHQLDRVGLGYIALGRSVRTLSGGEKRRLALAAALVDARDHTLFLIDEPEAGLSNADLARLVALFDELARSGHAVVCATHCAP